MANNFPYINAEEYIPVTRIEHWCQFDNCFANNTNIGKLCTYNGEMGIECIGIIIGCGYGWMDKKTPVYNIFDLNSGSKDFYLYLNWVKVL